jgi:uncharacterized protein YxjI
MMHPAFQFDSYLLKRQVLALTGKFRLYDPNDNLVLFCQQKMFKLKEDIRIYSDENKTQELLYIKARQILDFSATYDVVDSQSDTKVGVLRRRGFRSMIRDEWQVLDAYDQPMGILLEDNMSRALLRRFILGKLLPQSYDLLINDVVLAEMKQRFHLFRYDLDLDFSMDTNRSLDRRLGIAAAILLGTIEGKQESA